MSFKQNIAYKGFVNSLFIESASYRIANRSYKCPKYFYAEAIASKRGKSPSLAPFLYYTAPLFAIVVAILNYVKCQIRYLQHSKTEIETECSMLLALTKCDTIFKNNLISERDYIVEFPQRTNANIGRKIEIFDLLGWQSCLEALGDSILSTFKLFISGGFNGALYSFTSFNFFLLARALKRVDKGTKVYFTAQKDRWALLVDSFPHIEKILAQHGTTFFVGTPDEYIKENIIYREEDNSYTYNMPFKLCDTAKIYVFTEKEYKYCMLSEQQERDVPYTVIGYNLQTSPLQSDKKTILIAGCWNFFLDNEKKIIKYLEGKGVDLYIKPHPVLSLAPYRDLEKHYNFSIVEKELFPEVDLVLSYSSTLAYEYENLNIKVVYYGEIFDGNNELINDTIDKILDKLQNE